MRILLINSVYEPDGYGGTVTFTRVLAEELKRRGHKVAVAATGLKNNKRTIEYRNGIAVYLEVRKGFSKNKFVCKLINLYNHDTFGMMDWVINDFGPDIIHLNHEGMFSRTVWETGIQHSIPMLATMHDLNWFNQRRTNRLPLYKKWGRYLINTKRVFKKVVMISEYMKEETVALGEIDPELLEVIWNGIHMDTEKADQVLDEKLKRDSNRIDFLFAGRLVDYKGVEILLDAWRLLKNDGSMKLHICGEGTLSEKVMAYSKQCPTVEYHGRLSQSELKKMYELCDVVIMPSLFEPFGLVFLEGIVHACAIVCSKTGALKELADYFGIYSNYDATSPESLRNQILHYSDRRQIRKQIIKNAEKISHFSDKREVDEYERLYYKLVDCENFP